MLVKVTLAIDNPLEATKAFLPSVNGLFVVEFPLRVLAAVPGTTPIAFVIPAYTCCAVCVMTMEGFTRDR